MRLRVHRGKMSQWENLKPALCWCFFPDTETGLFSYISYILLQFCRRSGLFLLSFTSFKKTSYDHTYTLIPLLVSIPDYPHTLQSISSDIFLFYLLYLDIWRYTLRPSHIHAGRVISILLPPPSTFPFRSSEAPQMTRIHISSSLPTLILILRRLTPFKNLR
jgi:hypothetical protein